MSITCSVFIATSLDGFIARSNGEIDWLVGATTSTDDHGYGAFMAKIDVLVMGRNSFEKVLTFEEWPYAEKLVIVLSTSLTKDDFPLALQSSVEIHPGPVPALLAFLEESGFHHVYVDGGKVIQSFLNEGAIHEMTITQIPVLIGSGIPLFGPLRQDVKWHHVETKAFESGFVQSTYRIDSDCSDEPAIQRSN